MVSFTGSTETGKRFLRYAADSNMKRVVLECGGKNPAVVFDDVAEQALREGRALDWCANSMPPGWRPARGSSGG